jgi:rare lipoprotein A (peptidoglycan hydrolase)
MPFVNGKFYANLLYGRALERARAEQPEQGAHWVTIDGHHVLIPEAQGRQAGAQNPNKHDPKRPGTRQFSGEATYYNLPGARTASGERFDPNRLAAAMTAEKARLGQTATVTYTYDDGHGNAITKTVSVIINDRGPFDRDADGKAKKPLQPAPGRVIDLTPAAFRSLVGTTKPGHVHVTVTVPNE